MDLVYVLQKKNNMRILHLISSLDKGGAENHLALLASQQVKNNIVMIVYLKGNNYWKKKLEKMNIKVVKLELNNVYNVFKLSKIIFLLAAIRNKFQPDIVHAHLSAMEFIGATLQFFKKKNYKFVITKHLDSFFFEASYGQNRLIKGIFIDKIILKNCDKVIFISNQAKKYFLKKIFLPKNKFKVIYYGFDNKNFLKKKEFKKTTLYNKIKRETKNSFVLCCIARHVKQKTLNFLIESFSTFLRINSNSKLILLGSGPETQNLKKISKNFGIDNKIIWINYSEFIKDILDLSDVFILPSKYEGLGLVLLEAMSAKKPIIATRVSAIPEVIKNGYNGWLVNHGDIKDLCKKILLTKNNKLNKKLILNSQIVLKKRFNLNVMIKKTFDVYEKK